MQVFCSSIVLVVAFGSYENYSLCVVWFGLKIELTKFYTTRKYDRNTSDMNFAKWVLLNIEDDFLLINKK